MKYPPGQLKQGLLDYSLASTRPPGVLITYGAPEATSDNFAFLAQVELIKSCDAPESNRIIMGCSLRKNVPASTSSPWCRTSLWALMMIGHARRSLRGIALLWH
jgi:hypothetical protein